MNAAHRNESPYTFDNTASFITRLLAKRLPTKRI